MSGKTKRGNYMIKINLDNNTSDNIETEYYQNIKQDFIKILHKIKRDKKFRLNTKIGS